MRTILTCARPDDHTGPTHHAHDVDVHIIEGDELLQELARTSGMYGASLNGSAKPDTAIDPAGGGAGAVGGPPGGLSADDDHHDGPLPYGPRRCEHGEALLSTGDIVPEFGGPEPDEAQWWCPLWCSRTGTAGGPVDPTEWVYRSVPERFTVTSEPTVVGDGTSATITIRAEKHPARPLRLLLRIADDSGERGYAMTLAEGRRLHRYTTQILNDLG